MTGTTISSTVMNNVQSDFATGLSTAVCKDGQQTITANLPMASHKLTGLSAGSANGDSVRFEQLTTFSDVGLCEGRLTVTSGTAVTTADVTNAETIYFTPYGGNRVAVYDGAAWQLIPLTEISIDVPDATQMQDVFIYSNAGTLTLELTTWTNDTTRATALTLQDGVLVKTGATTRRYVGSFYSTTAGNGQVQDAVTARYLWNYYNRVERALSAVDTADSWAYSTNAYRQANGSASNQLNFCVGFSEDTVKAFVRHRARNSAGSSALGTGIGLDRTNGNDAQVFDTNSTPAAGVPTTLSGMYSGFPGIGKHFLAWLEIDVSAVITTTWLGDSGGGSGGQTGIQGTVWG